ncbi:MAG: S24/S26 family peptidase [Oscillospiraceae bacterium]|nr:S24/S26 family peptidase [Oscillospiraceae bacterium]MBQ8378617.1 S24/S26 family peptidase [Oscillospiraceae bacterium]MBQ8883359.1 S24/S26 family peptidase [Oscillospiraceae bacterium]
MPEKGKFKLSEYDETIRFVLENGGEFRLYPRGTSMLPLLREGKDSVCLIKADDILKKNDIVFYLRDDGHYVLHRIVGISENGFILCGDNQTALEKFIKKEQIIGVVNRIFRGEKEVSLKGFKYRFYLLLWKSFFVRKVFFKLRRTFKK